MYYFDNFLKTFSGIVQSVFFLINLKFGDSVIHPSNNTAYLFKNEMIDVTQYNFGHKFSKVQSKARK
jgi:hypothetical protein